MTKQTFRRCRCPYGQQVIGHPDDARVLTRVPQSAKLVGVVGSVIHVHFAATYRKAGYELRRLAAR